VSTDITSAAVEFLNRQAAAEREALARDARALADVLNQFADDVDSGLAMGKHSRVAQDATQFLIRATTLRAKTETVQVFSPPEE